MLDLHFKEEIFDFESNCVFCKKKISDVAKNTSIWSAPPILIIQLKRDKGRNELKANVNIPLVLNMSKYINYNNVNRKSYNYELFSVGSRFSIFGISSGHCYSYCKNNDKWYCYNDDDVEEVDDIEKIKQYSHILYYKIIE